MKANSGQNLLIVDTFNTATYNLRTSLMKRGHHVHVVSSFDMALLLAHRKSLHTVFLEYSEKDHTKVFCAQLDQLGIPHIFLAPSVDEPILLMGPSYRPSPLSNQFFT